MAEVSTVVDVSDYPERHIRPLVKLPPERQPDAIKRFSALPKSGQTAKAMEHIVKEIQFEPVNGEALEMKNDIDDESQTPIGWYGGKFRLRKMIVGLMPPHTTYVEPFFGGGSILFTKSPSRVEIAADVNNGVVTFFKVLRNEKTAKELHRRLTLTPYSREEHRLCCDPSPTGDEIEDARRFFVRVRQSYSSIEGDSWARCIKTGQPRATDNANTVDRLLEAAIRLRKVQIESRSFADLLPQCDTPDALVYCDPTYPEELRTGGGGYLHEMSDAQHEELLEIVTNYKSAKVLLSGYRCKHYDQQLKRWTRHDIPVTVHASGARGSPKAKRVECLWRNF
jgi:DNA adenine methylase